MALIPSDVDLHSKIGWDAGILIGIAWGGGTITVAEGVVVV